MAETAAKCWNPQDRWWIRPNASGHRTYDLTIALEKCLQENQCERLLRWIRHCSGVQTTLPETVEEWLAMALEEIRLVECGNIDWGKRDVNDVGREIASDLERAAEYVGYLTAAISGKQDTVAGSLSETFPPKPPECYVTLLQMASIVSRSKSTLERPVKKASFPPPDVQGTGGKPSEWRWSIVRPALETEYERPLPELFPADRFMRSL